jgi:hypothetical protein
VRGRVQRRRKGREGRDAEKLSGMEWVEGSGDEKRENIHSHFLFFQLFFRQGCEEYEYEVELKREE